MAGSSWQSGQGQDTTEDLESILKEDSDTEFGDSDVEIDFPDIDPDYAAHDGECIGPPPSLLGYYSEEEEEIPLSFSPSILRTPSPPAFRPISSPVQLSPSSAIDESLQGGCQPYDVVVVVMEEDETAMDQGNDVVEENFHLADEHNVQKVAKLTQSSPRGPGRGRIGPRGTRGQRRRQTGEPQWEKGDRLVEIHVNDEDVPEDLRAMIMQIVNARTARQRTITERARKQRPSEANDETDEWLDADEGTDEACATDISSRFEWSPMHDYKGKREKFLPKRTGAVTASKTAYRAFRQYWDDEILTHIVTETNRYAQGLASSSAAFAQEWYDTNIHEILVLFCFWILLGIIKMPTTKSCFTMNPLLQTSIFRKMFSRSRYYNICRALQFNDYRYKPTDNSDRLFCFGPILKHLNSRFMKAYVPSQNICIDESLSLWKGNLPLRQYTKTKASKFGVKSYELCDSKTGYLWSFFLYSDADTKYDTTVPFKLLKSTSTVLKLVHPLLNKGYTLFLDSYFNRPELARYLKAHKTDCVGTLRANRSDVPPLISVCQLEQGQFLARHSGDIVCMAYQDIDRKVVTISTYHGVNQDLMEQKSSQEAQYKPQVVLDYNKSMGGVDRKDQMLEPYMLERRKCNKWNMRVFKRLLNCSVSNSRIHLESSTSVHKDHLVFRLELVEQLLEIHHKHMPRNSSGYTEGVQLKPMSFLRQNEEKHWPKKITKLTNGRTSRRRCVYCSTQLVKHSRTSFLCSICDVPLCFEPCFNLYHSKL